MKGHTMSDVWLKMIIMDDFDKALLALDMQIEYVSGYSSGIEAADIHLKALKTTRDYIVKLHEEYMVTSPDSPFGDPARARWMVDNGYLENTKLYKKVKHSGKHLKPPGDGGLGGPGGTGGGNRPTDPKPPSNPPGVPPRGTIAGPPPEIEVPGGGFSFHFIMEGFHKLRNAGIITGGTGAAGAGGTGGFALLSQMFIGLAGSGSIVALTVTMTAGDKAEDAMKQAKNKGQQSELNEYFSYLANWAKRAWKALSSEDNVEKIAPPVDFTTWLNRRPPQFGY